MLRRVALLVLLNSLVSAFRFSGLSCSVRSSGVEASHSGLIIDSVLTLMDINDVLETDPDVEPVFFFGVAGRRSAANMTA